MTTSFTGQPEQSVSNLSSSPRVEHQRDMDERVAIPLDERTALRALMETGPHPSPDQT